MRLELTREEVLEAIRTRYPDSIREAGINSPWLYIENAHDRGIYIGAVFTIQEEPEEPEEQDGG